MRLDFPFDKMLMQDTTAQGGGGSTGDRATRRAGADATDGQTISNIEANQQRVTTTQRVTGEVTTGAANAGIAVTQRGVEGIVTGVTENAARAAQFTQENLRQLYLNYLETFNQSVKYQMANENSIEAMKANFSGMIEVLGIVAKHCGAEEFGDSCIELAQTLRPENVVPDQALIDSLLAAAARAGINPEQTVGLITGAQGAVDGAVAQGQVGINTVRDRAIGDAYDGTYVGRLGPDTGTTSGGGAAAPQALGSVAFSSMVERQLTGTPGQVVTITEKAALDRAFTGIAGSDGVINTPTEVASLRTAIRGTVASQPAENRLLEAAGLAPAPS